MGGGGGGDEYGHLSTFTYFEALNEAFGVQFFRA